VPNSNEANSRSTAEDPDSASQQLPSALVQTQIADPSKPAWGVGGALLVWLASILLVVFMPLFFLIPYAVSRGLHFGNPNYLPALVELATNDKTGVLLQLVALFPVHILTLVLAWALITRFGKRSFWTAIGWEWPPEFPWWLEVIVSVALGIVLFVVGNVLAKLLGAGEPTKLEQIINSSIAARYTISFLAVFTAPFAEEMVYRGVLYAPLERLAGKTTAIFIVLALFTFIHVPQYWPNLGVIAAVALLSIALTLVRAYSGRLLPCVVIHLVFNGIQAIFLILEPYLRHLVPTPEHVAPPAGVLLTLINLRF
jgi:membrane protease YdiL (CAAX protease family)